MEKKPRQEFRDNELIGWQESRAGPTIGNAEQFSKWIKALLTF